MARLLRNQRRARAALAWAVALFLLAQLTASLLLDYVCPLIRFPSAARVLATARAWGHVDVVCLGSSRFESGISPPDVSRLLRQDSAEPPVEVLNAAVPCGSPVVFEFLFDRLLQEGARPSLVVVEVSPETLNDHSSWLSMQVRRQLRWDDVPTYLADVWGARELPVLLQTRLLPLYSQRRQIWLAAGDALDRLLAPAEEPPLPAPARVTAVLPLPAEAREPAGDTGPGRGLHALTAEQEATSRGGAAVVRDWLGRYHTGGTAVAALERLARRCREHGMDLVLFGVPVSSFHRQAYTPDVEAAFRAQMDRLTRAGGCRFVDCRDQVPDGLFRDVHHLLPEGGRFFSRKLAHDVLAPVWHARHRPSPATLANQTVAR